MITESIGIETISVIAFNKRIAININEYMTGRIIIDPFGCIVSAGVSVRICQAKGNYSSYIKADIPDQELDGSKLQIASRSDYMKWALSGGDEITGELGVIEIKEVTDQDLIDKYLGILSTAIPKAIAIVLSLVKD